MSLTHMGAHALSATYTETADVLRFQTSSTATAYPVSVANANTSITVNVTQLGTTTPWH